MFQINRPHPQNKKSVTWGLWGHSSPTKPNMLDEIESETRKTMGVYNVFILSNIGYVEYLC